MILTTSNMDEYFTCQQRFRYSYGEGVYSRFVGDALWIGQVFHKAIEIKNRTGSFAKAREHIDEMASERWNYVSQVESAGFTTADDVAKAESVLCGMVRHAPWEVFDSEKVLILPKEEVPVANSMFNLAGKIDGWWTVDGKKYLFDYKTASRTDMYKSMDANMMNHQANLYVAMYNALYDDAPAHGFTWGICKKPGIKQTQKEDLHAYCLRVEDDYGKRPDFYFHTVSVPITPEDSEFFWEDYSRYMHTMAAIVADKLCSTGTPVPPERNRFNCLSTKKGQCPYYDMCRHGWTAEQCGLAVYGPDYHPELSLEG